MTAHILRWMGYFARNRRPLVLGFVVGLIVFVPIAVWIYFQFIDTPVSHTGTAFFVDPIFEGEAGDSIFLTSDEWSVGDFIVCQGVGSTALLGAWRNDAAKIDGIRLDFLDDGGLRVVCEGRGAS